MNDSVTVYLGSDYRCYLEPADDRTPFTTDFFSGREELIGRYRVVPDGESWVRADGVVFHGEMICPCSDNDTSPDYLRVKELEAALAEIQEALNG